MMYCSQKQTLKASQNCISFYFVLLYPLFCPLSSLILPSTLTPTGSESDHQQSQSNRVAPRKHQSRKLLRPPAL